MDLLDLDEGAEVGGGHTVRGDNLAIGLGQRDRPAVKGREKGKDDWRGAVTPKTSDKRSYAVGGHLIFSLNLET